MQIKKAKSEAPGEFFAAPLADQAAVLALARHIVDTASGLRAGVNLLVATSPLALPVKDLDPAELVEFLHRDRLAAAAAVTDLMARLGSEVKKRDYLLDELADEVAKLPAFSLSAAEPLKELIALAGKGLRIVGLPAEPEAARKALLKIGGEFGISLEYLLGNATKLAMLLKRIGVRDETVNASGQFHNYMSGFLQMEKGQVQEPAPADLLARAAALEAQGTLLKVFRQGDFNKLLSRLTPEEFSSLASDTAAAYGATEAAFLRFIDAVLARKEVRLKAAPELPLTGLLQAFKFAADDRDLVSHPAAVKHDDPTHWHESELGKALTALRPDLNWLTVSSGIKAAGDPEAQLKNKKICAAAAEIRAEAEKYSVTLYSGRSGARAEYPARELTDAELLFDLYCLAVLEKRSLNDVLAMAQSVLQLIGTLENSDPVVNLDNLVAARLAGESVASVLSSHGLVLRNFSLLESFAKLKALGDKVRFTIHLGDGRSLPLENATLDEFRKAVILMGRGMHVPNSPGRVLSLVRDKIVPEIKRLPKAVIAQGSHELARIIELSAAGVPARYPLRRPWTRVNLDPLTMLGSGLAPGIRNCLGCPVNSLYGLVTKTALASGFDDLITYEATGCFEVYSGIWPYTGKQHPTLHGVFGGAPSELLGGLAAKKARLKYAHKIGGEEGAAQRDKIKRTLHLGWGGDGATFDIGFGNLSGLFSRLQKLSQDDLDRELDHRALYVCYDNEGYQNTGNQYSAASAPGGQTTTNPQGQQRPMGNDLKKKRMVEIMAEHGATVSARMNIHRPEHITRVVSRALEDGIAGAFLHFLQPCTTGWKFTADSLTYDLAYLSEEGGLFAPVTFEHGVPYLEMYPTPRNPGDMFLRLQARFRHLMGGGVDDKRNVQRVMQYYADEWQRNLELGGYEGEIPYADRLGYLEEEHRKPRINV
jgi:pyruvate ferredoxin oxidoreductase beta subunit